MIMKMDQVFQGILQQIDDFQSNGSGWLAHKSVTLDLGIVTYTPWTL